MLNEKLLDWKYYFNKLPVYLQNAPCFPEHFKIWYELLTNINSFSDDLLGLLNIYDEEYLDKYNDKCSEFLDYIGALYGVKRHFSVNIDGIEIYIDLESTSPTRTLRDNNKDFLILIKCQICKNYNDGTWSQIKQYYNDAGLTIFSYSVASNPANVNIYLQNSETSSQVNSMFLGGLLTVQNLGITQNLELSSTLNSFLIFDGNKEWSQDETYGAYEVVLYNNTFYVHIGSGNSNPEDVGQTDWIAMDFQNEYDATTTYSQYQIVLYNGKQYISLENNNLGNDPDSSVEWHIVSIQGWDMKVWG